MKKILVSVVTIMLMSIFAVQAATVANAGWYKVIVSQVGLRTEGTIAILIHDEPSDTTYNLPGPQWIAIPLDSAAGKSTLAVFLTALATEKPAMVQVSPLSDGVCSLLAVTVDQ